ncbi:hypothetical protein WKT02_11520 [Erysipelotrichaceae bacterium HCN-30851]
MKDHVTNKSISFLMEVIIVIFFFTIASSISVLVFSNAKEKNDRAENMRQAVLYGESLIAQKDDKTVQEKLQTGSLYLDENGKIVSSDDAYFRIVIIQNEEVNQVGNALCTMQIYYDEELLSELLFPLKGGIDS